MRAFTLFELLIVIAIVTTLAAIAAPRYATSLARYRVDAAAKRVAADLDLARRRARTTSAARIVDFGPADASYRIPDESPLDGVDGSYEVDLTVEPYQVTQVQADFDGSDKVTFDMYGAPDAGGIIVVRVNNAVRAIIVDEITGQVTIQ